MKVGRRRNPVKRGGRKAENGSVCLAIGVPPCIPGEEFTTRPGRD